MVEIDPGCNGGTPEGSFDAPFMVKLRNFTPNVDVTILFGESAPQQRNVVVGAYGAADAPLTFTIGGISSVPILAFETNNRAISASTTLRMPCEAVISVTPKCDAPADPLAPRPLSLTVEGRNWDARTVFVGLFQRVPGGEAPVSSTETAVVSEQSTWTVVLSSATPGLGDVPSPLMALPAGDYFVRATHFVDEFNPGATAEVDFAVPCPQVVLTPNCGDGGGPPDVYDIAVSGSGWRPFARIEIIFEAANPQVFLLDVGGSGQLLFQDTEEARIRPFRRPDGQYSVIVRQRAAPEGIAREASAAFIVPCPPQPQIRIEPDCGPPQVLGDEPRVTPLRAVGANLPPTLLTITIQPPPGGVADVRQFGVQGSIDEPFDIPRRPLGQYAVDITLVDAAGGLILAVPTFVFVVPCEEPRPRLRLRCDPEETNLPDLAEVVLEARGFYPDAPVELALGSVTETVRTDVNGEFVRRTPASQFAPGQLDARMTQRDSNQVVAAEATRSLILPCGTRLPTLVISPPAAAPGQVVLVTGFNLRPSVTLSLRWSRGIGSSRTIDVTTDADGVFEKQVLLFHHDFTGSRDLTVETSADPLAVGTTVTFIVAPGSGTPPSFGDNATSGFPPLILRR